jgi:Fic family protein
MKAEQSALTQSLRTDLKNALEEVEAGNRRSRELEEFKGALETLLWFVNRRADSILWGARSRLCSES